MAPTRTAVYLLDGVRTPFGRYRGALAGHTGVDLGASALAALLARHPGRIRPDGTLLGVVLQGGLGQNPARAAALRAGVPGTVPGITLNSVCPASLEAVCDAARRIRTGYGHSYLVGGFDSMSTAPDLVAAPGARPAGTDDATDSPLSLLLGDGLTCSLTGELMGTVAERGNADHGWDRAAQDRWALLSQRRAAAHDPYPEEIVPVDTPAGPVRADSCVRPSSSAAALAALQPAFAPGGTITAGNASQLADGAAVGLVGDRIAADRLGVDPLARVVDWQLVAGADAGLHARPGEAVAALLDRRGLHPGDIDRYEINEAFAGVVLSALHDLGLAEDVVNAEGGAIARGHPLGATGFRLLLTLALQMRRRGERRGVAALCGGGGQGLAVLLERP